MALHVQGIALPGGEMLVALSVLVAGASAGEGPCHGHAGSGRCCSPAAGLFHGYAFGESIFGAEASPLAAYLVGLVVVQAALATGIAFFARQAARPPSSRGSRAPRSPASGLQFWRVRSSRHEARRLAWSVENAAAIPYQSSQPSAAQPEAGMIKVKRISHATFETPDLERQIEYFTQVAGLALAARENGRAYLATKVGDLAVQLEKGDHARCARIAFQVDPEPSSTTSARGWRPKACAARRATTPRPAFRKMVTFEDPKGTVLEVFAEQTPIAKNQPVTGIGPLKLGHLAFCVDDPKKFVDFYSRVLGFRVSDWIQDWFVFMRCGPDHHTINFVRGKRTQMHHIAFELKDWAQILAACDFLGGKNIQLIWGPGRHGPGHNIYTYHRNPDDQIIELFTELDKMLDEELGYFDPRPWHRDRPQKPKVWEQAARHLGHAADAGIHPPARVATSAAHGPRRPGLKRSTLTRGLQLTRDHGFDRAWRQRVGDSARPD